MNRLSFFMLGAVLTIAMLGASTLFAQNNLLQLAKPLVIDVQQSVPVVADVALPIDGEVITATLPLTVAVNLQVAVSADMAAITAVTPSLPVEVVVSTPTTEGIDDLGLRYTIDIQSDALTLLEWTAYERTDGHIEFFGEVELAADIEPIEDIVCVVRLYKAGKLVKVQEILNVAYTLKPGGTNRFTEDTYTDRDDVDSYTVTCRVVN